MRINLIQATMAAAALMLPAAISAQSCGNDVKYRIPYKNTYVKEPLTAENIFRVMKPDSIAIGSFEEARKVLPAPIWNGHSKEIRNTLLNLKQMGGK